MSRANPVLDVADALDPGQREMVLRRWVTANPRQAGARVADVLYLLADADSDLDMIETFYDTHPGLPDHPAAAYALRALIWGRPDGDCRCCALTRDGLAGLLRAVDARLGRAA